VDPPLKDWTHAKPDVVAIEYHTSFPYAGDPFYQANVAEQEARRDYAGIFSTPSIRFDGVHAPQSSSPASYESLHGQRKAVASRIAIELRGTFDPMSEIGTVTAIITAETALAGDWSLRLAVTESMIDYAAPNGIQIHDHVFRRFLPDADGTALDAGATPVTVVQTFSLESGWNPEELSVVALVQDDSSGEIEQGAVVHFDELTPVSPATWGAVKSLFRR
jgi:hypothetical protein